MGSNPTATAPDQATRRVSHGRLTRRFAVSLTYTSDVLELAAAVAKVPALTEMAHAAT